MTSIDTFITVPLIVCAVFGLLLLLALFVLKLKNKTKPSFIFYLTLAVFIIGSVYSIISKQYIYFVFAAIIAEFLTSIFLLFKTFDDPQKREAKKAAKAASESTHTSGQDTVSASLLAEQGQKFKQIQQVHTDFVNKVSTFFSSDNSMENFLEYCNSVLKEKVNADGCIILIQDEYDNVLAVKSFTGSFIMSQETAQNAARHKKREIMILWSLLFFMLFSIIGFSP